ncbi:MAG: 16S rRNA (uracil(1498)-N(3))-methyltransferase [Cellvibrionaceae bacterium]|nr:16S rRNA (uracil(1498)-N(3))-methyltransferase [Cellvibrionaceae bacterium]
MRVPRLYVEAQLHAGSGLTLDESQSHYLGKVLRMEPGRELQVFNGDGREYRAVISKIDKRAVQVDVQEGVEISRESPLPTHLAIGISRGERMDWVLQKATELGVSRITPLFTERTEVRLQGERLEKKMQHWRQITLSACEQCQRNVPPQLLSAQELGLFLRENQPGLKLVLHHRSDQSLRQLAAPTSVTLLVGPEGGLSEREIELAIGQSAYAPLTLGPRVLRTETAPVAALVAVQMLWGDLG